MSPQPLDSAGQTHDAALRTLLERPAIQTLMALFNGNGATTRIIGGAVRNTLLGLPTTDVDFATTMTPEETIERAMHGSLKVVPTGIAHGTVTVIVDKTPFEVTTLRRDVETDGRHAVVAFSNSFEEDAHRRDFTINQLSLSGDGELHDYANGLADLAARKVRFIGAPERRITEDYLRIMRFSRFHAQYGEGALDTDGLMACKTLKDGMARLSAERMHAELMKLLAARNASVVMPVFVEAGIWQAIAGNLVAHVPAMLAAIDIFPGSDAVSRLGALAVRSHEDVTQLERRLRLSGKERTRLKDATAAREQFGELTMLTNTNYKLIGLREGETAARDALHMAASALGKNQALKLASLPIPVSPFKGTDLLALGVPAGPLVGAAIEQAIIMWADQGFPDGRTAHDACLRAAANAVLTG